MENTSANQTSVAKLILIYIPLLPIALLILACFFMTGALFVYAVATAIAYKSAMIFLILFGASFIVAGMGLGLIIAFRKYLAFCLVKSGKRSAPEKTDKTRIYQDKKSLKSVFSLSNISLVILFIGAIAVIISAVLGSTKRDNWIDASAAFKNKYGFYEDVHKFEPRDTVDPRSPGESALSVIKLDLSTKDAVIIYNTDADKKGFVVISGYARFEGQLALSRTSDGVLTLTETAEPKISDSLGKMIFFAQRLTYSRAESQVRIYIPLYLKETISIEGEYIIAK